MKLFWKITGGLLSIGSLLVVLLTLIGGRMSMTYSSFSERDALIHIATQMKYRSQWDWGKIGAGYGREIKTDSTYQRQMFYYPIRRLLVYGSQARGWKEIHGVSIADINHVVEMGGELEDLEK